MLLWCERRLILNTLPTAVICFHWHSMTVEPATSSYLTSTRASTFSSLTCSIPMWFCSLLRWSPRSRGCWDTNGFWHPSSLTAPPDELKRVHTPEHSNLGWNEEQSNTSFKNRSIKYLKNYIWVLLGVLCLALSTLTVRICRKRFFFLYIMCASWDMFTVITWSPRPKATGYRGAEGVHAGFNNKINFDYHCNKLYCYIFL